MHVVLTPHCDYWNRAKLSTLVTVKKNGSGVFAEFCQIASGLRNSAKVPESIKDNNESTQVSTIRLLHLPDRNATPQI